MRWLFLLLSLPLYATNLSDFAGFARCWEKPRCWECRQYDYTGNGVVDLVDLQVFAERWLMSYPNKLLLEQGTLNSSGLNGVYTDSGELLDGKPKYIKDGGTAYIRWYTSTTQWAVVATPTILVGPSDPLDPTGEYDAYSGATGTAAVTEIIAQVSRYSGSNLSNGTRDLILTHKRRLKK